jgi:hypothetical protein
MATLGPEAARRRTYAYWWLWGTRFTSTRPREWGARQARLMFQQLETYREWIDGRVLFVDIEEPLVDPEETDTWEECAVDGVVVNEEGCEKNRAVVNGFMGYVARVRALAKMFGAPELSFASGVYTSPEFWIKYFGADFVPEVMLGRFGSTIGLAREARKEPFVLWITGCATSVGVYNSSEADEIRSRDLFPIVNETTLGGSKAVWWQYHIEKPDFNVTDQNPTDGFTPISSAITYTCSCDDPELARDGTSGSCPPAY